MKNKKIINFFEIPIIGKYILIKITQVEGGDKISKTIRKYFKNNKNVDVDMYSYGGCFDSRFNLGGKVKIGRYCSFGQNIRYFGANHPLNYITTSPYFYNKKWGGFDVEDVERHELEVGNDVWIGYGTIITSKCKKIGNGAVIGAGTIVTKDVPPYSVVVGNPGRIIKYRFDNKTIDMIEKSKWWDLKPEKLMDYYQFIDDPDLFSRKIIEYKEANGI